MERSEWASQAFEGNIPSYSDRQYLGARADVDYDFYLLENDLVVGADNKGVNAFASQLIADRFFRGPINPDASCEKIVRSLTFQNPALNKQINLFLSQNLNFTISDIWANGAVSVAARKDGGEVIVKNSNGDRILLNVSGYAGREEVVGQFTSGEVCDAEPEDIDKAMIESCRNGQPMPLKMFRANVLAHGGVAIDSCQYSVVDDKFTPYNGRAVLSRSEQSSIFDITGKCIESYETPNAGAAVVEYIKLPGDDLGTREIMPGSVYGLFSNSNVSNLYINSNAQPAFEQ